MRSKIFTAIFLVASVLALWAVAASKPPAPLYTIDTPYEYPIVPGTQEWIDLGDVRARRKACQVPDEIIQNMTTDALLLTVLDYPFMCDIYAYNTMEMGYEAVKKHCNSLRAFEQRPDHLDVLSRYCEAGALLSEDEKSLEDYMAAQIYHIYTGSYPAFS